MHFSNDKMTASHEACIIGRAEIVQFFVKLSKNFSIDLKVRDDTCLTALHKFCYNGKTEIVQLLITLYY